MKKISSYALYAFAAMTFCSSLHANNNERNYYKMAGYTALVIAGVTSSYFFAKYGISYYHTNCMNSARTRLFSPTSCPHYSNAEGPMLIDKNLNKKKEKVINAWKSFHQYGALNPFSNQSYSGNFTISNVVCSSCALNGSGLLSNSIISNQTTINGNLIAENSQLNGNVVINNAAEFASFNNCLLGSITYNNDNPNATLELRDTIVEGDITFTKPGIIVASFKTIIAGKTNNCKILYTA
jgi:hypothetical protein